MVDCFQHDVCVEVNSSSSSAVLDELMAMQTWNATLPFSGLIGMDADEEVDLFDYTHPVYRRDQAPHTSPIKFDPLLYPPNKDGLKKLNIELKMIALKHGSNLIGRNSPFILDCFRCHLYKPNNVEKSSVGYTNDYDGDGVKVGIRQHVMHHNRKKIRTSGRQRNKGTKTRLPMDASFRCNVKLSLKIYEGNYIYMLSGYGNRKHVFHTRPKDGSMNLFARHCGTETRKIAQSCGKAAIGATSSRYVTFEHCNDFLSASTARVLKLQSIVKEGSSTGKAQELIKWLREMAIDESSRMGYCLLSHQKNVDGAESNYHRNPKGRPSKRKSCRTVSEINEQMTYEDVVSGTFETLHHPVSMLPSSKNSTDTTDNNTDDEDSNDFVDDDEDDDNCNDDNSNISNVVDKDGDKDALADVTSHVVDYESGSSALFSLSEMSREVLADKNITALKVMLGAAWIDENGWKMFHRFPEVAFFDTTFKTNNEGRPLFLMVGRDSNGRGFIVLRIYMPNETKAFFMWIFSRVMVMLLGKKAIDRINLLLSDGDAQEYTALDDSTKSHVMTNAYRGRCCRHLVHKTWEKDVGDSSKMNDPINAAKYCALIRHWVYSWMNGKSAHTRQQYELSKDLLFRTMDTNEALKSAVGGHFLGLIKKWLREKIVPNEQFYAFYLRQYNRSFEENTTNIVEGMNYGSKKADLSAKPNMSMKSSAERMHKHTSAKMFDRDHDLTFDLSSTPLYVKREGPHNIDCLSRQVNLARHLIIEQFKGELFLSMFVVYGVFNSNTCEFQIVINTVCYKHRTTSSGLCGIPVILLCPGMGL